MSPFNAWLLLKAETLELRVERQCRTAEGIARFLEGHPKVTRVLYPGLPSHPQYELARRQMSAGGTVVAFDIGGDKPGDKEACFRFLDALQLVDISNNLGDSKSLITHPATTTHSRLKPEERRRSASATRWCGCRRGSKAKPIWWPISGGPWRRFNPPLSPPLSRHPGAGRDPLVRGRSG
jgi:cystathionine beta-lyase/cystathionine gamma-synthase